jgi:hypothetical protein
VGGRCEEKNLMKRRESKRRDKGRGREGKRKGGRILGDQNGVDLIEKQRGINSF